MASSARAPLGPLIRAIEVYFAVALLTVIGYGLVMTPAAFHYDVTLVRVLLLMSVSAVSLWLIELRSRATRPFVIASLATVLTLTVLDILFGGDYPAIIESLTLGPVVAGGVLYFASSLFIIGYFAWGRRPREVFVERLREDAGEKRDGVGAGASSGGANACDGAAASASGADACGGADAAGDVGAGAASGESAGAEDDSPDLDDGRFDEKPFSWPWWRNLGIYFCAFSILGHWAEIAFCWLIVLGVFQGDYDFSHAMLWSQWLFPYSAEGIAVVLIVVILYPIKRWLVRSFHGHIVPALIVSFLINALVCTGVDFTTGIVANQDYSLWDYRDLPFNFMGQVCLQNSLVYSIAATLIVWVIYPLMARLLHRAPRKVVDGVFFGLVGLYAFLAALYFIPGIPIS